MVTFPPAADLRTKHYDIMLYLANWGSKQLAFRFLNGAIDEGGDWIEEEGHSTPLAPLGDDLLRGDLRAL